MSITDTLSRRALLGPANQGGMTLIEILVALLVLAIGLLGIAGLQGASLKSATSAYWQSQATWTAYDMADRMRANSDGVEANAYDAIDVNGGETAVTCSSNCNPSAIAQYDIYTWGQQVAALPAGQGVVGDNNDGTFTIAVMWDETGSATGTGCDPSNTSDKTCVQLNIRP